MVYTPEGRRDTGSEGTNNPSAWQAARRPCSIDTDASAGGPMTSPAAYTPRAVVWRFSSTWMWPRLGERDAGGVELEAVDIGDAPERHQDLVGEDLRPSLNSVRTCETPSHFVDDGVGARNVFAAVAAQLLDVERGELGIEERQRRIVLVGLRHLAAERGEHRGVFAGDDAAAEHQQAARQVGQREDGIAVEHVLVVDGEMRRRARPRAGGDDDDGARAR